MFGIAVEVTLRLIPIPEATRTALAAYPSLPTAGDAVAQIVKAGLLPVAMEIMDALAIEAAEACVKPGYPPCGALLIVELEGERGVVDADAARLEVLLRESGATAVRSTEDPDERALIWKGRKSAFSAVGWLSPDFLVQDGVVPRTRLGEALAEIGRMSADAGIRVANVFHAGDGNLHPLILYDGRGPRRAGASRRAGGGDPAAVHRARRLDHRRARRRLEKRAFLPLMFSEDDLELMRRVRASDRSGRARQPRQDAGARTHERVDPFARGRAAT